MHTHPLGLPLRVPLAPGVLEVPLSSFFLVSTEITGWRWRWTFVTMVAMYWNCSRWQCR